MPIRNIPEFHQHTFSLDTGTIQESFVRRELELGTGYITTTDHGSHAGCISLYKLAKKENLKPILGLEGYLRDDNCPILGAAGVQKDDDGTYRKFMKYQHFTIHYKDQEAYEKGGQIISNRFKTAEKHGSEYKPIYTWEDIEEIGQYNITLGSGCLIGVVSRFLLDYDNPELAIKYYEKLRSCVKPGNFYVEVFPHDCSKNWVKGIFVTLSNGIKYQFTDKKKLITNVGEVDAITLSKDFKKAHRSHLQLKAIRNKRSWDEIEPLDIVNVEQIEDYLPNECTSIAPDGDPQKGINKFLIELANKYGDPIVPSGDSHYAYSNDKVVQDIKLGQQGNWRFYGDYSRKSGQDVFEFFQSTLGINEKTFEKWTDTAHQWASNFDDFKLKYKIEVPAKFYPEDTLAYCYELIEKHGRMDWNDPVRVERLKKELKLFHENGVIDLLPYFFTAEKACDYYSSLGDLTGAGRGSAGGVYLNYLLNVVHVDPIRYKLSLERFITEDRIASGKMPDVDFDFGSREPLTDPDGFLETFFKGHYAQISTSNTLKARGAVKDVFRALHGSVPEDVEFLTKNFEQTPQGVTDHNFIFGYKKDDGEFEEGSIERDVALQTLIAKYPKEWEVVKQCLAINRSFGRHAAGFCITNRPIEEFIPLHQVSDIMCTQYTHKDVEFVGALKFDFLNIKILNDLSECIEILQKDKEIPDFLIIDGKKVPKHRLIPFEGTFYDIWDLPQRKEVFEDIIKGRVETVFQFDTPQATKGLEHFNFYKPNGDPSLSSIEDLAIFTSLDRPGGLEGMVTYKGKQHNILVEFARRSNGEEPAEILPEWEALFPETYGLCVFQEQLMKAYQYFTDCTLSQAEQFRSDVGKKLKEKLEKAQSSFIEKAGAKLRSREKAQIIWDLIIVWSSYGFNASHATAYAVTAYACAFFKHYYNLEWWTAVLRNADKNEINEKFWKHCGHLINLPDIRKSTDRFEVVNGRIQAPLNLIKGIAESSHKELCDNAPYESLDDFVNKIRKTKYENRTEEPGVDKKGNPIIKVKLGRSALTRGVIYSLIISDAMNSFFPKDIPVYDKIDMFEEAYQRIFGAKKKEKIDPFYLELNQFKTFQMKKEILQCFSEPLLPIMTQRQVHGISEDNDKYIFNWKQPLRFIDGYMIQKIEDISILPKGGVKAAAAAYIEDFSDIPFTDKKTGKRKRGAKISVDINGSRFTFVKWPGRIKLEPFYNEKLIGSICVVVLNKYSETRPFTIEELIVVQPRLQDTK